MNVNRRDFLRQAAATAAAAVMLRAASSVRAQSLTTAPARRPNFLIVMADDMGFSDAGCFGGEIATPTLDSLARGGIRFTQCYSTARCWPSRSCLLTGYYAQQVRADPPIGGPLPK